MTFKRCNCYGKRTKFNNYSTDTDLTTDTDTDLTSNTDTDLTTDTDTDLTSNTEQTYIGDKIIKDMWTDIEFTNYPTINNNNFTKSLLWGTKWNNLPNNEFTWTINYNNTKNTIPDGDFF